MNLFMHSIASIPLGVTVNIVSGSTKLAAVAVVSSIFIDLDHILDYLIEKGYWGGVNDFFVTFEKQRFKYNFVFFHAWEWLILLWIILWFASFPPLFSTIVVGVTYHLIFDQAFNKNLKPLFYFIIYRAINGFLSNKLIISISKCSGSSSV